MLQAVHGWSSTYERLVKSQKFFSSYLTQEDLSRLGRNSALTGLYTNFTFPQYGVRYIAINDNYDTIDPNSVNNDFAGIKNWFNEFYARDTSRKIRAVQKAKGERGVPLTVNVPYGYVKDPENPKHWLVDPEAAAVVKRIFSMCMEGRGPSQIAKQLQEDKVLTVSAYEAPALQRSGFYEACCLAYRLRGSLHCSCPYFRLRLCPAAARHRRAGRCKLCRFGTYGRQRQTPVRPCRAER